MITHNEFVLLREVAANKAEKKQPFWQLILELLDEAAPLIFEGGKLKWYQVGRAYKLAALLIKFIKLLKDEFSK